MPETTHVLTSMRARIESVVLFVAIVITLIPCSFSVSAAQPEINVSPLNGLALHGFDPVAYFTESKPVRGSDRITTSYKGAVWAFTSEENRELFVADPDRYAPQYGGYCAYAVSQGATADVDPVAWQIFEGKLYLNYNSRVQRLWGGSIYKHIEAGDANWPDVLD